MKCEKPLWVRSQAAFSFKAAYAKPRPAALPLSLRSPSARLIEADRHALGDRLKGLHFDLVVDTAYAAEDIKSLAQALDGYDDYVLISSSAVYQETTAQPFSEEAPLGRNAIWGDYGLNKIAAERALSGKRFNLPKDGLMKLQFFYVGDLCEMIDALLAQRPRERIFNVGNKEGITVKEWVELCYEAAGRKAVFRNIYDDIPYREYFCFPEYEYILDVEKQERILNKTMPMKEGLKQAFNRYLNDRPLINVRNYRDFD